MYKLSNDMSAKKIGDYLSDEIREQSSYDCNVKLAGSLYLNPESEQTIDDIELLPESVLIVEVRQRYKKWVFYNDEMPPEMRCPECYIVKILKVVCGCKKVYYCS